MALLRRALAAAALAGCTNTVVQVGLDADVADDIAAVDVPATPLDARPDAAPDARRDAPPDDVDPTCANGATDRCLGRPPGPCADLSDGRPRTVRFAGFRQDHALSCAGRMTGSGPDAVLPLRLRAASDVSVTVTPSAGDTVIAALVPVDACGEPARELQCLNGTSTIGGILVLRVPAVAPGDYALVVGTARGGDVSVVASVTAARPREPGDACPGVELTPDGPPVTVDTRRFYTTADYGTSCGYGATGSLGWVDAVARFTLTAQRDVTVSVSGDGDADLHIDVTRVCGASAFVIPGCDEGNPATRTLRNLPAGTYWATVDYRPDRRPDHTLSLRVTTAAPTPPGPAARCPGVALPDGAPVALEVDTLTAGPELACLPRQRFSGFLSFTAPAAGLDVMLHAASPTARNDVALGLRARCDGDLVGACVGPEDRTASSVWRRYRGLTPGQTYVVQAGTNAIGGMMNVRRVHVPAATPQDVRDNYLCAAAAVIPAAGGVFRGTTDGASVVATPFCATAMTGCAGSRGALYRLDLTERRRVVATMEGAGFDTLLAIQPGDSCPGRMSMFSGACNDDWFGTDSHVDVTLNAGRYWVHAGGCGGAQAGAYTLDVAVLPP